MALSLIPDYTASRRRIRYCYYYYSYHYQFCERLQIARPGRPSLERLPISLSTTRRISTDSNSVLHSTRSTKRTEREAKRSFTCCTHIWNKWVYFNIILLTLGLSKLVSFLQARHSVYLWSGHMLYISVSQPPGRGPVPDPGINYTGPREVLLEVF
jgi:hypothetical protein